MYHLGHAGYRNLYRHSCRDAIYFVEIVKLPLKDVDNLCHTDVPGVVLRTVAGVAVDDQCDTDAFNEKSVGHKIFDRAFASCQLAEKIND